MISQAFEVVEVLALHLKANGWGCVRYGYKTEDGRVITHGQGEASYVGFADTLGTSAYVRDLDQEVEFVGSYGACGKAKQVKLNLRVVGYSTEQSKTLLALTDKLFADVSRCKFTIASAHLDVFKINTNYAKIYEEETDQEPKPGTLILCAVDLSLYFVLGCESLTAKKLCP